MLYLRQNIQLLRFIKKKKNLERSPVKEFDMWKYNILSTP